MTTLQTAERALAFLEVVAQAQRPPRLKDVASVLNLNITTSYHLLNTLLKARYLTRESDGTLRIGGRVAILYQGLLRHFVLGRDLRPVIEALSARTGETAYVASLSNGGVVIQALVESAQAVRVTGLYVGFSGSEHIRASGKAVLAHLSVPERDALLKQAMGNAPMAERRAVASELEVVRERGWAVDDGGFQEGVCCIAAPFFGAGGEVAGSVAVSLPAGRFPATRDDITRAVQESAMQASVHLGHHIGLPPK